MFKNKSTFVKSVRLNHEQMKKINTVMKLKNINASEAIKNYIDEEIIVINKKKYIIKDELLTIFVFFLSLFLVLIFFISILNILNTQDIFDLINVVKIYNY
jgi:hypothetical protein